jgi:hypothetical protein
MKIINRIKEHIPAYAMSYLINGDNSGLSEDEIKLIDHWYDEIIKVMLPDGSNPTTSIIINPISEESFFSSRPCFGLPCDVIETDINIMIPD